MEHAWGSGELQEMQLPVSPKSYTSAGLFGFYLFMLHNSKRDGFHFMLNDLSKQIQYFRHSLQKNSMAVSKAVITKAFCSQEESTKIYCMRYEAITGQTDSSVDETRSAQCCPTEGYSGS